MFCWHKWIWESVKLERGIYIQTAYCEKCRKAKWRYV